MGLNAKARVAMTNAVSSHMEWVRSLSFEEIAIAGTTPEGIIEPTYTYTVDGFQVTIDNQISTIRRWDDTRTRRDRLGRRGGVHDRLDDELRGYSRRRHGDHGRSGAAVGDPGGGDPGDGPIVEFTALTPEEDAVSYGAYVLGGSPLYIEARAEAQGAGDTITDLRYYCAGELLRDGNTIFADVAEWQPGVSPANEMFRWDTRQVNDGGDSIVQDGWRVVYVIAVDSTGAEGRAERRFYVDNHDPGLRERSKRSSKMTPRPACPGVSLRTAPIPLSSTRSCSTQVNLAGGTDGRRLLHHRDARIHPPGIRVLAVLGQRSSRLAAKPLGTAGDHGISVYDASQGKRIELDAVRGQEQQARSMDRR